MGCQYLIVGLLILVAPVICLCPLDCECGLDSKDRRQVICSLGGMTGTPPVTIIDLDTQVLRISAPVDNPNALTIGPIFQHLNRLEELRIVDSNLPAIGKHSFWGVPTLKVLDLQRNNISQVLEYNFRGLANLLDLHLDNNLIESMGSGTFRHLTDLKVLTLSRNRMRHLSPRLFLMLAKLRRLDLSYNRLEHLDPGVFKDVQELRVFACRGCGLRAMNPHIYSLMSGLTHLDLGDNEFKYLGTDWFTDLKRLQVLEIDGNHFPVVLEGTFGTQYKLQELVLSRNRLAKVTTHAFTNLSSLVDLDLSYNKLIKLETQTLAPMTESLRSLKVSGNNLDVAELTFVLQSVTKLRELAIADMSIASEDLPIGMLVYQENLRLLNLSGNEFTHFPVQVLSPVPKLSVLDLSRNKFQGLDERLVARLESVGTVRLERNPWSCDLCHITPLLSRVNRSASFKKAVCSVPAAVKGRTLESLNMASLSWCGSGVGYRDESFAGLPLTHNTQLGLIAAGAAVALLVVTAAAIVAGLLYNKHHAAYYYTHEEKRGPEHNAILQKNGVLPNETVIKKVSIATIDEITKDPDLQVLANGT